MMEQQMISIDITTNERVWHIEAVTELKQGKAGLDMVA